MQEHFKATKINDNVYWVGVIDWEIRNFHGYNTSRGTTYNAYLVLADKITLIDVVKPAFKEEMFSRIASVIPIDKIDYVVSNHSEMDHSGCLPELVELAKPEKIFASQMGQKILSEHFEGFNNEITIVNDGETISLGNKNLQCHETRMLHWPDSMISYLEEDKILFSNDIFGMHLASFEKYDYELDDYILDYEAAKYFANIILPYSSFVTKTMDKLLKLNLELDLIAPDHGPMWKKNIKKIVDFYQKWPLQHPTNKALVIYDTMWGSTQKMADAIAAGLGDVGVSTNIMPTSVVHRSDIATEVLEAGAIVVGSPILNNNIYPALADVLTYIRGLKPIHKVTGSFGSYGWNDVALDELKQFLADEMKLEYVDGTPKSKFVPTEECLKQCYQYGIAIGNRLKEKLK